MGKIYCQYLTHVEWYIRLYDVILLQIAHVNVKFHKQNLENCEMIGNLTYNC